MKELVERLHPRSLRRLKSSLAWFIGDATGRHGVPPARYRVKVHGSADVPSFLAVGESCAQSLLAALDRVGATPADFSSVLDFGCGVGRTLIPLSRRLPHARLFGTDIDSDAIRWCRRNLDFATFGTNPAEPPLPYEAGTFDLIYAVSVFSHLDEELQFRWLEELQRVAQPGALLLLSVHGPSLGHMIPADQWKEFDRRGFWFLRSDTWSNFFPDFYHTSFHTREYVREHWTRHFEVVDHLEKGLAGYQDLIVLRARPRSGPAATIRRTPERLKLDPVPDGLALSVATGLPAAAGHIERLQLSDASGVSSISGWLVIPDRKIVALDVHLNGVPLGRVNPAERPDVEAALPQLAGARESGFHLAGDLGALAPRGWAYIEVVGVTAEGPAGAIGTLFHPQAPAALPAPPPEFSQRVVHTTDTEFYRIGALRSFTAFLSALRLYAPGPESSLRVLDWGAGCGRLTAAYARFLNFAELHACDIDPETTAWAQEQLRGEASFRVIEPFPPTPYETGTFDVVLAYSVMTHLDRETQRRWLHEMRRLLRPGGLFLASVHGAFAARATFDAGSYAQLLEEGIHDGTADPALDGIAPRGYYRGTFQTRDYTEREWGQVFEILEYRERGMNNWQDLVVMRAPGESGTASPNGRDPVAAESVMVPSAQRQAPAAGSPEEVVAAHWGRLAQEPHSVSSWTDSPLVVAHVHRMISGDPEVGWVEYVCRKYLLKNGRGVARGLSLGCGSGSLERGVRALGACDAMDAYDLAPGAIEEAKKAAARDRIAGIDYAVADLNALTLPSDHYDVVFASMSVHHISNLEDLFANVARSLKPEGLFIMLEYVGPAQFQFSDEVLGIINDLLALLPAPLRARASQRGEYVTRVARASLEHMNAVDPSEAIRSAEILPLLAKTFTILEKKDFGGTLSHVLLQDIVGNFDNGSPEREAILNLLLHFEMLLVERGILDSDFCLVVARPR